MLVKSKLMFERFGDMSVSSKQYETKYMAKFTVPEELIKEIPCLPKAIYCNKELFFPFCNALKKIIKEGYAKEITSYDGCFAIRLQRGSSVDPSIHSYGLAVDLSASNNPRGLTTQQAKAKGLKPFSLRVFQIFKECGFVCGIDFAVPDGMHIQLLTIAD